MATYKSTIEGHEDLTDDIIVGYIKKNCVISIFEEYRPEVTKELIIALHNAEKVNNNDIWKYDIEYGDYLIGFLTKYSHDLITARWNRIKEIKSDVLIDGFNDLIDFGSYLSDNHNKFTSVFYLKKDI